MSLPKTAIIYLCWADEPKKYLGAALDAIAGQTYPKEGTMVVVVYNGPRSGEESQLDYIRNEINDKRHRLPDTVVLEPGGNVGFSAGNNFGARYAVEHGADYIFLHNADGFLKNTAIAELVRVMESDKNIGECQPLILLYPERHLINSAGNEFHYLGIGFCASYRDAVKDVYPVFSEIGYVSGAAAFMRADLLKQFGYWSDRFFLYHEDTEYSQRLKVRGYKIGMAGQAVFYHQYEFSNKPNKFFWIERNRHALKLLFYKWPTLILLLPLEIVYNVGLLFLSAVNGWFPELIKVYGYWLKPKNWRGWLADRKILQKQRIVSDRQMIFRAAVGVGTGDLRLPAIIRVSVNFIFTIYWYLLKILIWW
ncbi:MAG: glycosyltransferase family 2 protein [Candidatus Magasanikbacteria bacterium]|nr:glycosyltransferase family 2 protein [Candidatus Magasanikbacteria bacterium]